MKQLKDFITLKNMTPKAKVIGIIIIAAIILFVFLS